MYKYTAMANISFFKINAVKINPAVLIQPYIKVHLAVLVKTVTLIVVVLIQLLSYRYIKRSYALLK